MTEAKLTHKGNSYTVDIRGHATGNAKVCAAVSSLSQALIGYLDNYGDMTSCEVKPGLVHIEFKDEPAAFRFVQIGLLQLAETEPKYIKVF